MLDGVRGHVLVVQVLVQSGVDSQCVLRVGPKVNQYKEEVVAWGQIGEALKNTQIGKFVTFFSFTCFPDGQLMENVQRRAKKWNCFAKQEPSRKFTQPSDHFLAHHCAGNVLHPFKQQ